MNEYKNSSTDFVENFLVASKGVSEMAVQRGKFFEFYAPEQIAAGGKFGIRTLTENNNKKLETILMHKFPKLVVENVSYVRNQVQDMLQECTDPGKLYNISGKFPAIDLYNPPFTFFQLTVRKDGHQIDFNAIRTICNFVRDRYGNEKDVNLYFVVPVDIFNKEGWMKMQSFKCTSETNNTKREILSYLKQFGFNIDPNSKRNKLQATKQILLNNDDNEIKS
jgi:hypothetical protein